MPVPVVKKELVNVEVRVPVPVEIIRETFVPLEVLTPVFVPEEEGMWGERGICVFSTQVVCYAICILLFVVFDLLCVFAWTLFVVFYLLNFLHCTLFVLLCLYNFGEGIF